jgi:hypothetical protein
MPFPQQEMGKLMNEDGDAAGEATENGAGDGARVSTTRNGAREMEEAK